MKPEMNITDTFIPTRCCVNLVTNIEIPEELQRTLVDTLSMNIRRREPNFDAMLEAITGHNVPVEFNWTAILGQDDVFKDIIQQTGTAWQDDLVASTDAAYYTIFVDSGDFQVGTPGKFTSPIRYIMFVWLFGSEKLVSRSKKRRKFGR